MQAFLDRDGAVGSLMGLGAWGLMARPWRFKAGAMFRSWTVMDGRTRTRTGSSPAALTA